MSHLFEGLKIVDAATFLAGPGAATVFGDYGADVIKVEPIGGDGYRRLVGTWPIDHNWLLTSRNKRSLCLDLARPEGQDVLLRLLEDADVLIVNFRPEQLEAFGLTPAALCERFPRLVFAQITGYGLAGPDANRKGFDSTAWWARTGLMDLVREPGQRPMMGAPGFGDHSTAMSLFSAIMMGLYRRERTGRGGFVSSSLVANGVWANGMQVQGVWTGYDLSERRQRPGWRNPFTSVYGTADDRFVLLSLANPPREWPRLAETLGHPEWLADPRFSDIRSAFKNRLELIEIIEEVVRAMPLSELCRRLDDAGLIFSVVARLQDVADDPHLRAAGVIRETGSQDPHYPLTVSAPVQLADEPPVPPRKAPDVGEHSRDILRAAGYSDEALDALIAAGILYEPEAPSV